MLASKTLLALIAWICRMFCLSLTSHDTCRRYVKFTTEIKGSALQSHVIKNLTLPANVQDSCRVQCVMESQCLSINVGPHIKGRVLCELSDSDHTSYPYDIKPREGFTYTGTENHCLDSPCLNNGTCLSGFSEKKYLCVCQNGDQKGNCEKIEKPATTCKALYDKKRFDGNRAYELTIESVKIPVYCHMTDDLGACAGGGWTLVVKMNGSKGTFHYDSNLWTNREPFNSHGGETGFDYEETKLPTYWNTSFSKICLGMKIGQQINFIVINKQADSLYSLIADGRYRATSLGRNTWRSLIGSEASLQSGCNKEGFNAACTLAKHSQARIGIIGNNQDNCASCDSRIGFGTAGKPNNNISCGNRAPENADNGEKLINTYGYIFVQ